MQGTLIEKLHCRVQSHPKDDAYFTKNTEGTWQATSWEKHLQNCKSAAAGMLNLGLSEGGRVCILGFNRPEWVTSCTAAQMVGAVSAGIYTACSPEEIEYIVNHAEAEILVLENLERFENQVKPILDKLTTVKKIVLMESDKKCPEGLIHWDDLLALGNVEDREKLDAREKKLNPNQLATLIYTSGTTGPPKAVMLSHKNLTWTVKSSLGLIHVGEGDSMVSYLPLAHIAEQMFSVYAPMSSGLKIYYAESMEKLVDNLKEVQPTVFFGVPRVYEKIYEKLQNKLSAVKGLKKILFEQASKAGNEAWSVKHHGGIMSAGLRLKYELANKLIFEKLKPQLGLSRARVCVSGAAPISKELIEFFMGLDLPVYEVYGQSEDCGPATFNIPGATRLGTVGRPLPGLEVKIAEDGEILVKGPSVFMGYFKAPEATEEVLKDGWLYSGDIGELTQEGYLKITDRKKDILITAGGKNIAPQNLEGMLKQISLVSSAVVVGDKRKYLAALLTPSEENLGNFAKAQGLSVDKLAELIQKNEVLAQIDSDIKKMNLTLAPAEQIKKFKLLDHDFSVESGELTPTMKVKRKVVNEKYKTAIDSLYASQ